MSKLLYHYTTMNTFMSMMEKSLCSEDNDFHPKYLKMWASNYAQQNDPTECKWFFDALEKKVKQYVQKHNIVLTPEDEQLLREPSFGMNLFTISFSEQEDDLTMWYGYGEDGDGVSLGFDFSELPNSPMAICISNKGIDKIPEADTKILYIKDKPLKCQYVKPDEDFLDDEIVKNTIECLTTVDKELKDLAQGMVCFNNAPLYKHYKYAQEKEYRIIKTGNNIKYQLIKNNTLRTYIEIKIAISCLKKIVVGPCKTYNSQKNADLISSYMATKGLNVEVVGSEIPYRRGL